MAIFEGGNATLHFYDCVMIAYYTESARKFSITETRPYAQYLRALNVNWTEPRKRNGKYKTYRPLIVSDGYAVIEVDGKIVYDTRADMPIDMDKFRAIRARFNFQNAPEGPPAPPINPARIADHQADLDHEKDVQEQINARRVGRQR
jgi:hypothetical protein